jgi:hypothetical protein
MSNTPALMAAAHKRSRRVSKARPMRLVAASGVIVSGTDALACAIAAMASDETRRYGRLARTNRRLANASSKAASSLLSAAVTLESRKGLYAVAGKAHEYESNLMAAVLAAQAAKRASGADDESLTTAEAAHEAWARYVIMPDGIDLEAHPTSLTYAYAAQATRRRNASVTLSNGYRVISTIQTKEGTRYIERLEPRITLEWQVDATRDVLDALRRDVLRLSYLPLLRATSPSDSPNPDGVNRRASKRKARALPIRERVTHDDE